MASPPTGTLTFLFTDIEGSTKLWEHNAPAMQKALARHDEILRNAIEERGGYVFKTVGDAFCCAFSTATDALEAALAAQRALHEERWSGIAPLRVRMALHTGVAEERDEDYFGPHLNRVARLLSAAHGGQVLLSAASQEMVRDQLPAEASLMDLGQQRLKDLYRPERVFQLMAPGLPTKIPLLRTLEARPNNLPLQPTPLVGREQEVAEVAELLLAPETCLLTLTGPGGVGKTRLALQAGADLLEEFEDGVFFVALAITTDPELVPSTIAGALGVKESAQHSLMETLKSYLRNKELLLLLDNFEQVLEGAPLVGELLGTSPTLTVLATSRAPLRLYGEQEYPVPPLALPDPRVLPPLEVLTQYEAVRLFVERARAVKPDFEVTNESAPAVAEICVRLDGLPLAMELAAARIRMLPPQKILERLSDRLKLLKGGPRDLPSRQQTLRGTIDWSYDLLEEDEKTLSGRLSVFSGGCTLEAIEEICDPEGDQVDVLEGVQSLLEKSLLRQKKAVGEESRYMMLETVHEYAREKLEESVEAEEIKRAHAEYFLALAEEAQTRLHTPEDREWLERLQREHDNLRGALSWVLERREAELGLRLGAALGMFWHAHGYLSEGRKWLEEALAKDDRASVAARVKALEALFWLTFDQWDLDRAEAVAQEGLKLSEKAEAGAGLAASFRTMLAGPTWVGGDYERAKELLEESLALSREADDKVRIADALAQLGSATASQGDRARAKEIYEEGIAVCREVGYTYELPGFLYSLGYQLMLEGEYKRGAALNEEAAALLRERGYKSGLHYALDNLGWAALLQENHEQARRYYEQSLVLCKELGERMIASHSLEGMACIAAAKGEAERAARLFGAAYRLRETIGAVAYELSPEEEAWREPYRATVRSWLDAASWEEALAQGRAMTMEDAISYAMEEVAAG